VGYNHVLPPNSRIPDCMDSTWDHFSEGAITARSLHAGGVNAVFADGAAKFVADTIDLKVWRALGSINGGEVGDGL
jgi:prepilin-type processing-associated H-X9-DG protein